MAFGASSRISKSAVDIARSKGIKAGLLRPVMLWPFPEKYVRKYVGQAKGFLSVEMNMGQMVDDIRLAVEGRVPVEFYGRTGGMIPTPAEVAEKLSAMAGGVK